MNPRSLCSSGKVFDIPRIVHSYGQIRLRGKVHQPLDLLPSHDLVRYQNVCEARLDHDLDLSQLGAGDATASGLDLFPGDDRAFMCLDMGPQVCVDPLEVSGHPGYVALHDVQVYHQGGRVDLLHGKTDKALSCHALFSLLLKSLQTSLFQREEHPGTTC